MYAARIAQGFGDQSFVIVLHRGGSIAVYIDRRNRGDYYDPRGGAMSSLPASLGPEGEIDPEASSILDQQTTTFEQEAKASIDPKPAVARLRRNIKNLKAGVS